MEKDKLIIYSLVEYNNSVYTHSFEGLNYHINIKINIIKTDILFTKGLKYNFCSRL